MGGDGGSGTADVGAHPLEGGEAGLGRRCGRDGAKSADTRASAHREVHG